MNKRTDVNKIGAGMRLQIGILICALWGPSFAAAATTVWTDWTSATNGAPGSAAGALNGRNVLRRGIEQ